MDNDSSSDQQVGRRAVLGVLGGALATGVAGCSATPSVGNPDSTTTAESGDDGGSGTGSRTTPAGGVSPYTQVYRDAIDSVVRIRVFTSTGTGQGSGFVWDDQHVVTNEHVVGDAEGIEVRFAEGDWRSAEVVGTDIYSDLAVIRIDDLPSYAPPLELVEEDPPVGTEVVALGNPFGFSQSVSAGIVSGVNRSLPGPNNFSIPDAVQTDAAVNPGNSGGPLVTLDGRVVGVISSGGGDNLGFAISAALMQRVIPALIETGEYDHSYMGVTLVGVSPTIAEANDLSEVTGVLIVNVVEDGPSDGVLQGSPSTEVLNSQQVPVGGDVVVRMGDREIASQAELSTYLALETSPGDRIPTEIIRDGERTTVELTLGERPEV